MMLWFCRLSTSSSLALTAQAESASRLISALAKVSHGPSIQCSRLLMDSGAGLLLVSERFANELCARDTARELMLLESLVDW